MSNDDVLIDCSNCGTPLQLPPGAESLQCVICQAITRVPKEVDRGVARGTGRGRINNNNNNINKPSTQKQGRNSLAAPSPPGPPPNVRGRKKALIIGVSYKNTKGQLDGCLNDAKCMRYLLHNRLHFPESSIRMLTEEETDPKRIPTKRNILAGFTWLVQGCQPGDSLVFHFSGHGTQRKDRDGDEADGFDEALCPTDHVKQGVILDDDINLKLVRPIPTGVKLHAIIDACHSGTAMDLPFLCRMDRNEKYVWEDHRPRTGARKGSSGGEVISFSACHDNQTSADTQALSKTATIGAMTFCFIQAIESGHGKTYGSLLNAMRTTLRETKRPGAPDGRFKQVPQLTAWQKFDVHKKPFSL